MIRVAPSAKSVWAGVVQQWWGLATLNCHYWVCGMSQMPLLRAPSSIGGQYHYIGLIFCQDIYMPQYPAFSLFKVPLYRATYSTLQPSILTVSLIKPCDMMLS